jgi:hypothetical protein
LKNKDIAATIEKLIKDGDLVTHTGCAGMLLQEHVFTGWTLMIATR